MATVKEINDSDSRQVGKLFQEVEPSGFASFVGNDKAGLANFLVPAAEGTGAIDVVNDFPWTLTPPKRKK
jgi:hypothetical protein